MLKYHLSIINHTSVTQFDDITLSNHDFDRVVGTDLHSVSGPELRPDLSLQTDFNETYYSVFSQAQRQVYRITKRSLDRIQRARANSCPDLIVQVNRELEANSDSHLRYTTAHEYVNPDPKSPQISQQTQTTFIRPLQVKDTGAQYSSPEDSSDSNTSDTDTDIEGTKNITVAKQYLHRHSLSSEDLYTDPVCPSKCFWTSTPEPCE